jgi:MFS family permease
MGSDKMNYLKNIKNYYYYSTFAELLILGPVLVMFLTAKGLSFTEIMVLQSISSIGVVVFEVPTGVVADRAGRKLSILLGSILWGISLGIYVLGKSFIVCAIAEIIFSLGASLKSGADSALIYDSLKVLGREKEYTHIEGSARSYALYAQAIGSVVAGFVFEINTNFPLIISMVFMIITSLIILGFKEPPLEMKQSDRSQGYFSQVRDSGKIILKNDKLKAIVFFYMIFYIFYRAGYWYYQPYMETVKIPVRYFGIIFFIFNIAAALSSKASGFIMERTKPKTLTFMSSLMIISLLLLGIVRVWPGVFAILFQQVSRGIYRPVITKYLNKNIPSDKRATILSFNSLLSNIAVAVSFPLLGLIKDSTDIFTTHLAVGGIMIVMTGITLRYMDGKLGKAKNIKADVLEQ